MDFGDSLQDASRSGSDDVTAPGAINGHGDGHRARALTIQRPLQDIQDIIDKLTAVTQQLRHPRGSDNVPSSRRESPEA